MNDAGVVTEVVSFDGRREELKQDAMNRVIRYRNGQGEITELTRDLLGRITEVKYPDDTSASMVVHERNAHGNLRLPSSPTGRRMTT